MLRIAGRKTVDATYSADLVSTRTPDARHNSENGGIRGLIDERCVSRSVESALAKPPNHYKIPYILPNAYRADAQENSPVYCNREST